MGLFFESISLIIYGIGAKGFFYKSSKHSKIFCYLFAIYSVINVIFFHFVLSEALDSEELK